jgi:hypothetical protein
MGSVKGKCNSKERRERIHGNFVQKKRLPKMCKKCQRRCYETPLPDSIPVNSGKVIRRGHMK